MKYTVVSDPCSQSLGYEVLMVTDFLYKENILKVAFLLWFVCACGGGSDSSSSSDAASSTSQPKTNPVVIKKDGKITSFQGAGGVTFGDDGKFSLYWQIPEKAQDKQSLIFRSFFADNDKIDLDAAVKSGAAVLLTDSVDILDTDPKDVSTQIYGFSSDALAPYGKGTRLGEFIGQGSHPIKETIFVDKKYLFQVKLKANSTQQEDDNRNVLVVSLIKGALSPFAGVESVKRDPNMLNSLVISWKKSSSESISGYRIYQGQDWTNMILEIEDGSVDSVSLSTDDYDQKSALIFGVRALAKSGFIDSNTRTTSPSIDTSVVIEAPSLTISPASYDYSNELVAVGSESKAFSITNSGGSSTFGTLALSHSMFTKTADTCSEVTLATNQSCEITVKFAPSSTGVHSSAFYFNYTDSSTGVDLIQSASVALQGTGVANVGDFSGIASYANLNSTQVDLAWVNDNNVAIYLVYKIVDGQRVLMESVGGPASGVTLTGLSPSTEYTVVVFAQDSQGIIAENTQTRSFTTPSAVSLSGPADKVLPATVVEQGDLVAIDINNDTGMATEFSCTFDLVMDGVVAAGANCSTLPGTVLTTDLADDGELAWTIGAGAVSKTYELKFTGVVGAASDSEIVVIQVAPGYSRSNLVFAGDFNFADGHHPGSNSSWTNLSNTMNSASLASQMTLSAFFGKTTSSGYAGDGTSADPYRLVFDGSDDYATIAGVDDETDFVYMGWVKPSDVSGNWTLLENGSGSDGEGLKLEHRFVDQRPYYVFTVGGEDVYGEYDTQVLADNPLGYWRFNTTSAGAAISNLGNSVNSTDGVNSGGVIQQEGLVQDAENDKAFRFGSNNHVVVPQSTEYVGTLSKRTVETWFNADSIEGVAHIAGYGTDDNSNYYGMRILVENGVAYCYLQKHYGRSSSSINYIGAPIIPGIDYHMVAVYDQTGNVFKCFLNGILIASETAKMNSAGMSAHADERFSVAYPMGNMSPLSFRSPSSKAYPFSGVIDDTSLYVTALSTARAKAHYLPKNGGTCGALNPLGDDEWVHLAIGYKSNVGSLYINGDKQCEFETPTNGLTGGASNLFIGSNSDQSGHFAGSLGLLTFYDDTSSLDSDVLAHYNATKSDYQLDDMHALIPRLVTWFDASDMDADGQTNDQPSNGATVTEWKDKTNYLNHIDHIYGTPVFHTSLTSASVNGVTFSADDTSADNDYMTMTQSGGSAVGNRQTAIVVGRLTAANASWHGMMDWVSYGYNAACRVFQLAADANAFGPIQGASISSAYTAQSSNSASIFILRRIGNAYEQEIDGSSLSANHTVLGDFGTSSHVSLGVFLWHSSGTPFSAHSDSYMNGSLFEVQLYNDYLTNDEVSALRTALTAKWK